MILADAPGFGNVGFNRDGSFPSDLREMPTPNLDVLAGNDTIFKHKISMGLKLEQESNYEQEMSKNQMMYLIVLQQVLIHCLF
ncbi:hypothetical protein [Seonamhaeicola sp.]|uniref:hypothetical protein n=1 Tax=Seonamhaeicola sp. TaxID=1912245 RepID=UPI00263223B5|nr:hypothetical protein [Seonamhaeicola sp.]